MPCQVEEFRPVIVAAERGLRQPFDNVVDGSTGNERRLVEIRVGLGAQPRQRFAHARQHLFGGAGDLGDRFRVALLAALHQRVNRLLRGGVLLERGVRLPIAFDQRVVDLRRVARREVAQTVRERGRLPAHVVDVVLGRDLVARVAQQSRQRIADNRVARAPHVERAGRVGRSVLNQHAAASRGAGAEIASADFGQQRRSQRTPVERDVAVAAVGRRAQPTVGERSRQLCRQRIGWLPQLFRSGEADNRQVALLRAAVER